MAGGIRAAGDARPQRADAVIHELIAEATVDAYDESEQTTGFYTMFEEHRPVMTVRWADVDLERGY